MILNELFALTLIPSLISTDHLNENDTLVRNGTFLENSTSTLQDFFRFSESDSDNDGIPVSIQSEPSRILTTDPLLAEILEEERNLNLAFPDDYFDHFEDKSEEVRQLIRTRKQAIQSHLHSRNPYDHEEELRRSRRDFDEDNSTTEFPILTPTSETVTQSPITSTSSTNKPQAGKGFVGSTFDNIHQGTHSIIDTISRPFIGARNLFGKKATTTTRTPTTIQPETLITESVTGSTGPLNCTKVQTEYNGQCYNVLQQLPCNDGEWLIEDETTNKGKCVENKCADKQGTAAYGGECIHVSTDKPCHPGMKTFIFKSGMVECDCKDGYLYSEKDGNCYAAYRQGPCPPGQCFIIPKKSGGSVSKPACIPNPCLTDGYFCNAPRCPRQRNCAQLGSTCGSEDKGRFSIHSLTNTPFCLEAHHSDPDPIIGNVPTLSCAPGTRRDILGNCRTPTDITFS